MCNMGIICNIQLCLNVKIKYSLTVNTVYYYSMYFYTEVSQFSVHIDIIFSLCSSIASDFKCKA